MNFGARKIITSAIAPYIAIFFQSSSLIFCFFSRMESGLIFSFTTQRYMWMADGPDPGQVSSSHRFVQRYLFFFPVTCTASCASSFLLLSVQTSRMYSSVAPS